MCRARTPGADADHLGVLGLVGDDLVQQRQHCRLTLVHDRQPTDLDDVEYRPDGVRLRFGPGDHRPVHQRLPHQLRRHMLGAGWSHGHADPPFAARSL
jgi:hypothetical protein